LPDEPGKQDTVDAGDVGAFRKDAAIDEHRKLSTAEGLEQRRAVVCPRAAVDAVGVNALGPKRRLALENHV
jgi:hypothetical protein